MSSTTLGLLIGGLVPAVLFALSGISNKFALQAGMGPAAMILVTGCAGIVVASLWILMFGDGQFTAKGIGWSILVGAPWAVAVILVAVAINQYGAPLSQLIPLYNMNTLLAVAFSLWIFAEWKQVHLPQILLGSVLIVAGGVLVSRA